MMSGQTNYSDKNYWNVRYGGKQIESYEWSDKRTWRCRVTQSQAHRLIPFFRLLWFSIRYLPWSQLKAHLLKPIHAIHTHRPYTITPTTPQTTATATNHKSTTTDHTTPCMHDQWDHTTNSSNANTTTTDAHQIKHAAENNSTDSTTSTSIDSQPPSTTPAVSTPICSICRSYRVLIVGCGNSELSHDMYVDGFHKLDSVDYSEIVIEKMRTLYADLPELAASFKVADCRDLSQYHDGEFDVIIDKGTLDALLCGSDSNKQQSALLSELHRVLKRGGVFLLITYGQPTSRCAYLERPKYQWTVQYITLSPTRFIYICTKRGGQIAD